MIFVRPRKEDCCKFEVSLGLTAQSCLRETKGAGSISDFPIKDAKPVTFTEILENSNYFKMENMSGLMLFRQPEPFHPTF